MGNAERFGVEEPGGNTTPRLSPEQQRPAGTSVDLTHMLFISLFLPMGAKATAYTTAREEEWHSMQISRLIGWLEGSQRMAV